MIPQSTRWRRLLLEHEQSITAWLGEANAMNRAVQLLSDQLTAFLLGIIASSDDATVFRDAVGPALSRCNEREIFEERFVPEAYACLHMVRRYWRIWNTLDALRRDAILPLGTRGVRALDVGSGPAIAPYALQDYYAVLSEYGKRYSPQLAAQWVIPELVEGSRGMSHFFHLFSEVTGRAGPFGPTFVDFAGLDLARLRRAQYEYWHNEFDDEGSLSVFFDRNDINDDAQSLHRYKLYLWSNFFTKLDAVDKYADVIRSLVLDARPGAVFVLIGALGGDYPAIFDKLGGIFSSHGAHLLLDQKVLESAKTDRTALAAARAVRYQVALHLRSFGVPLQGVRELDVYSPEPDRTEECKYRRLAFRKGRWPTGAHP